MERLCGYCTVSGLLVDEVLAFFFVSGALVDGVLGYFLRSGTLGEPSLGFLLASGTLGERLFDYFDPRGIVPRGDREARIGRVAVSSGVSRRDVSPGTVA